MRIFEPGKPVPEAALVVSFLISVLEDTPEETVQATTEGRLGKAGIAGIVRENARKLDFGTDTGPQSQGSLADGRSEAHDDARLDTFRTCLDMVE